MTLYYQTDLGWDTAAFSIDTDSIYQELRQLGLPEEELLVACTRLLCKSVSIPERLRDDGQLEVLKKGNWETLNFVSISENQLRPATAGTLRPGFISISSFGWFERDGVPWND